MKIAYLSTFDPLDKNSWSGCSVFLARALAANPSVSIEFIGPLKEKASPVFELKRYWYKMFQNNYLASLEPVVLRHYAYQAAAALVKSDADVILSLDAPAIAYLETTKPIIYFWDCTFLGNLEYPWFSRLSAESIRCGHEMEQRGLDRCQIAVYSSEWAVETALKGYKVNRNKIRIVPLGANLECNRTEQDVVRIIGARPLNECRLLFLGVDWQRKGGDVAFNVARELNSRGVRTTLTIVGCQPFFQGKLPGWVRSLGFINKFENDNMRLIEGLLAESHFLIVPSIAESFGAVFCEASSFGTPSLARRIGGVPAAVRDGVNGKLFSKDASFTEYCDFIQALFKNYSNYRTLALSSFAEYQNRLNWNASSKILVGLFRQLMKLDC